MKATLIDWMGDDITVVNAARVSFDRQAEEFSKEENHKLIRYLARNGHWTPFGHASATFHFKAPIFVARQLVKHQVGLVWNEVSRRYIDTEPEFFEPKLWKNRPTDAKQGAGYRLPRQDVHTSALQQVNKKALDAYNQFLAEGMAPEQARMVLPLNTYTEWYWTGSLAAWARVWKLRVHDHAQAETRELVEQIDKYLGDRFPVSWEALKGAQD